MVGGELASMHSGMTNVLLRRVSSLLPLSAEEQHALAALERNVTEVPASTRIVADGALHDGIAIVESGWVMCSRSLPDGRRQVISFALSGDVLGLDALAFQRAHYDLSTLSRAVVARPSVGAFVALFSQFPRLASAFNKLICLDEAILTERLLSVSQRSSAERVSHLFLELWHRLKPLGMANEDTFLMPLTQDVIGDALGLSTVHVCRTLKTLQRDGLIRIRLHAPRSVTILDRARLQRLAGFSSEYLRAGDMPIDGPMAQRSADDRTAVPPGDLPDFITEIKKSGFDVVND